MKQPARPSCLRPLFASLAFTTAIAGCDVESSSSDLPDLSESLSQDVTARPIDPIDVGHAWTYDVEVLGFYPICSNGRFTANTTESVYIGGRWGKRVQSLCEHAGTFIYAVEGDRVWSWYGGEWILSLDAPVRAGHTWSDGYDDFVWERIGDVTVPAGRFTSCWSATKLAARPSYTIFCRGVGPVHWHYEDRWGNGYDAVLVSKSF